MSKFKRNSNKKVIKENRDIIFPKIGSEACYDSIRTISFTPKDLEKLDRLKSKYKVSRSALIRILLERYPEVENE